MIQFVGRLTVFYGPLHHSRPKTSGTGQPKGRNGPSPNPFLLSGPDSHPLRKFLCAFLFCTRQSARRFSGHLRFCRWADDLGDEISSDTESLSLLNWWQDELLDCFQPHGKPWHPVHVALAETIRRHNLPKEPFLDLIAAFKQDRAVKEYESVEQLEDYCTRSANPVGRLVLHLAGAFTPQRALLSDFTCTGLQLANFWQDVARDRAIGRIYLPGDARTRHGVSINDLDSPHASPDLKKLILELVSSTRSYFVRGEPLEHELPFPINRQIGLFRRGGLCILDAIEQQQGDVLTQRPTVSKRAKLMLIATAALGTGSKPLPAKLKATPHDELLRSRAWCQRVARTQAGNFSPHFAFCHATSLKACAHFTPS